MLLLLLLLLLLSLSLSLTLSAMCRVRVACVSDSRILAEMRSGLAITAHIENCERLCIGVMRCCEGPL